VFIRVDSPARRSFGAGGWLVGLGKTLFDLSEIQPNTRDYPVHIEAASLCGVMITAAVTYVFAIPANSYHWQMEIWNRGGGTWTFDKNGRWDWKWMVEPISDTPPAKRAVAPSSQTKVRTERL